MTELAAAIRDIPMPEQIKWQRIDKRGFPVPWFVHWEGDQPDFRVIGRDRVFRAVKQHRCWVCGGKLGRLKVSVIGPMCAVNKVTSEPPCHPSCARYAVQVCPFLTQPRMRRNEKGLPEERLDGPGIPLDRNPGVAVLWSSLYASKPFEPGVGRSGGVMFELGTRYAVEWWARGRLATRAECEAALDSGLPILRAVAETEGPIALAEFEAMVAVALKLLPEG